MGHKEWIDAVKAVGQSAKDSVHELRTTDFRELREDVARARAISGDIASALKDTSLLGDTPEAQLETLDEFEREMGEIYDKYTEKIGALFRVAGGAFVADAVVANALGMLGFMDAAQFLAQVGVGGAVAGGGGVFYLRSLRIGAQITKLRTQIEQGKKKGDRN